MYYQTNGKLVRGVIYDDVNTEEIKREMFDTLNFDGISEITNKFAHQMYEDSNHNVPVDDAKRYFNQMEAIAAVVGYDLNTEKTNHLVIPRDSVSVDLEKELDKVDLGKNLLNEYADSFFIDYLGAIKKVEPEDFCKGEEEDLLKYVDKSSGRKAEISPRKDSSKEEPKFFVGNKRVTKDEFEAAVKNDPEMYEMFKSPLFDLFVSTF